VVGDRVGEGRRETKGNSPDSSKGGVRKKMRKFREFKQKGRLRRENLRKMEGTKKESEREKVTHYSLHR